MQQQHLTKTVSPQWVLHEVRHMSSASRWVVDSKPLEPSKQNVSITQVGCGSSEIAPVMDKKN